MSALKEAKEEGEVDACWEDINRRVDSSKEEGWGKNRYKGPVAGRSQVNMGNRRSQSGKSSGGRDRAAGGPVALARLGWLS